MKQTVCFVFLLLSSLPQVSVAQQLRDVIQTTRLDNGAISGALVNREATMMDATMFHIDRIEKGTGRLLSRGVAFFEPTLDRRAQSIGLGGAWLAGEFVGDDETATLLFDHCGAIYAGGVVGGRRECIEEILNRRRSVLIAATKVLSVLNPAVAESWGRNTVVGKLAELRALCLGRWGRTWKVHPSTPHCKG